MCAQCNAVTFKLPPGNDNHKVIWNLGDWRWTPDNDEYMSIACSGDLKGTVQNSDRWDEALRKFYAQDDSWSEGLYSYDTY